MGRIPVEGERNRVKCSGVRHLVRARSAVNWMHTGNQKTNTSPMSGVKNYQEGGGRSIV